MLMASCSACTFVGPAGKAEGNTLKTQLSGEINVTGDAIVFLRPDGNRFRELEADPDGGAAEVDSDFGFAISNTIDSINANALKVPIAIMPTTARYINLNGCQGCPMKIDRDTVNYGYILTGNGRRPATSYNTVHSGDYLQEIRDFFGNR